MPLPGAWRGPVALAIGLSASAAAAGEGAGGAPRFVNVAPEAGITRVTWTGGPEKDHLLESTGVGAALVDIDGDGLLDVYLVNSWALDEDPSAVRERGRNALYRNRGDGTFEDVTEAAGVGDDGWGCGVCAGDIDNDGTLDLYVTNYGPNVLYRNRGDGTFEDVTGAAGVGDAGWGAGCAFFDSDNDGDLDLYVANYVDGTVEDVLSATRSTSWRQTAQVMAGPFGMRGGVDRFYRNDGDGRFADATDEAGMTDHAESYGLGVLASDLDLDGDVDVYVANDSNPNFLYQNRGDGTFEEIGGWCGAGYNGDGVGQAGMGVAAGDLDGDGLPELLVTNFARDYCTIYRNTGELFFEDASRSWKMKEATYFDLSWGCAFVDVDLDADLDVVIVNGHIYPQVDEFPELEESYRQRPSLLLREDDRLERVDPVAGDGFGMAYPGRGLAVGDYDQDGDPDLLMTGMDVAPQLLRNDGPRRGRWLGVRVLAASGAPAFNARVRVVTAQGTQFGEVLSGSSYQSQGSTDLLFGLGDAARADTLEVRWLGGESLVRTDVSPDQRLTVRPPGR